MKENNLKIIDIMKIEKLDYDLITYLKRYFPDFLYLFSNLKCPLASS